MNQQDLGRIVQNLDWPDNYYERLSGKERKQLLDEAIRKDDNEENRMRLKIWEDRYGQVPKGDDGQEIDNFMKLWMDLEYASSRIGTIWGLKSIVKPIRKDMELLGITRLKEYGVNGEKLMYREMVQMGRYFFSICSEDRSYTAGAFGLSRISNEKFVQKITGDVYRICYQTPKAFGLEKDLEMFVNAITEALETDFPGQKEKLMSAVQAHLS